MDEPNHKLWAVPFLLIVVGLFLAALTHNYNPKAMEGINPCPDPEKPALASDGSCVTKAYEGIDINNYNQVR